MFLVFVYFYHFRKLWQNFQCAENIQGGPKKLATIENHH